MPVKLISGIVLLIFLAESIIAGDKSGLVLSADSIRSGAYYLDTEAWRFMPGDKIEWAEKEFNDSDWVFLDPRLLSTDENIYLWEGIGWFRYRLKVDSSLVNKPLALNTYIHAGASEIYLNGVLISEIGEASNYSDEEKLNYNRWPRVFEFNNAGDNIIAVRYSNHKYEYISGYRFFGGFSLSIDEYYPALNSRLDSYSDKLQAQIFFAAVILLLVILHSSMLILDKTNTSNLYYVLFLLSFGAYSYINNQFTLSDSIIELIFINRLVLATLLLTIFFGSATIISIFSKFPKYFYLLFIAVVLLSVISYSFPVNYVWYTGYALIVAISWIAGTVLFRQRINGLGGEWIIRTGFIVMSLSGIYQMFLSFGWFEPLFGVYVVYNYGVLFFIISMSILLARDFVQTNKNLEFQLVQVKELSKKTLEQELSAKELETEKKILEADNARKTKELEEARELQLSMLPKELPRIRNLDIAVYMSTATEVGGDYYDFGNSGDGNLTVAIGDATGHGTRAGIMVSTVKSLFSALGGGLMIPDFFNKSTEIIKKMRLGNLFMSMQILRINGNYVTASNAGMPPILVYRKVGKKVEEFILKGMPLGAFESFPYPEAEFELKGGDVILLVSDGLPELFNAEHEMFGDKRVKMLFEELAVGSSESIIDGLTEAADNWRGDLPQQDDITFVVIKSEIENSV